MQLGPYRTTPDPPTKVPRSEQEERNPRPSSRRDAKDKPLGIERHNRKESSLRSYLKRKTQRHEPELLMPPPISDPKMRAKVNTLEPTALAIAYLFGGTMRTRLYSPSVKSPEPPIP